MKNHNGDNVVHNGDKVVHNGDKVVHNGDKVVHNGDTNNTIDNTNNNTKTTPGGVDVIRAFVAETFAIPITGIGVAGLRKATKGKPLSAVADTVRKFKAAQGSVICQKDGQVQGVGLLMDALKAIPREKTPKEMSEEEISALFSAPAKIPETTSGNKAYQDGWKQLKEHLKLTELDQDDLAETKYAYARRFGELGDADVVASIDKFLKDLPGEHGTSIADLCAAIPDAAERGTYLRNALNKN